MSVVTLAFSINFGVIIFILFHIYKILIINRIIKRLKKINVDSITENIIFKLTKDDIDIITELIKTEMLTLHFESTKLYFYWYKLKITKVENNEYFDKKNSF